MTASSVASDVLEAVIADARRHMRLRRLRASAIVLLLLLLAAAVIADVRSRASQAQSAGASVAASATAHNGPISILAGATASTDGWYDVSRISNDGKLHPLIRCPQRAKWCGEPESIAWTVRGDRLAL